MDEPIVEALPEIEPWAILSGEGNAVWDDVFDWIANAINTITRAVTDWVSEAWAAIVNAISTWVSWVWANIKSWFDWLWGNIKSWFTWLGDQLSELWGKITGWISATWASFLATVRAWFTETWETLSSLWSWIASSVTAAFEQVSGEIGILWAQLTGELSSLTTWLAETVTSGLDQVVNTITELIPEWVAKPFEWIGVLLDGALSWFEEDIPGHSPRWESILATMFPFMAPFFVDWGRILSSESKLSTLVEEMGNVSFINDLFTGVFESFMSAVSGFIKQLGPMSPDMSMTGYESLAKVGMVALGGLASMTIAGEFINPLSHLGLGHISAMIYDMTSYKTITGVFMGALTFAMLRQPLSYYFNSLFQPMIMRERDFTLLMSRHAFTDPETLQNPDLSQSMAKLAPGGGAGFESAMMSYYGYPPAYLGLFRELANTKLGYFALAGVARTGFYEEAWFKEALHRTGYSTTAVSALMKMMYELYVGAKLLPVMSQIRRLFREGFTTREKASAYMDEAIALPSLADVRLMAMDLEQQYEAKSIALDISLRAFSRGVIPEIDCRNNLAGLDLPGAMVDVHLYREKLGLIRRISWTPPEQLPAWQFVEE